MVWVSSRRRHAALLTVCLLLTVLLILNNVSPHCEEVGRTNCQSDGAQRERRADTESRLEVTFSPPLTPPPQKRGCLAGVVTVKHGGRFANLAFEYASAWAVTRRFDLQLAVPSTILGKLSAAFPRLSAQSLEQVIEEDAQCNTTVQKVLSAKYNPTPADPVDRHVEDAIRDGKPVVLRDCIVLADYIVPMADQLRQEFLLRPELQQAARSRLDQARRAVAAQAGCRVTEVCTVGVHVRRTDYARYLRHRFGVQLATVDYYTSAADAMRRDLQAECAAIAFVVTSDDRKWCKNQLLPALNATLKDGNPPSSAFLMSSSSAVQDLCLLSSCQHSILSYGTYSALAGLLTGGRAIVYDLLAHGSPTGNSLINVARAVGPSWKLMP